MTMMQKLLAPLFGKGGRSSGKCRLGWLSTWNAKCGIAEYSKFLLDEFDRARFDWTVLASRNDKLLGPDRGKVIRCWTDRTGSAARLLRVLKSEKFDQLVIQFNFGFLSLPDLAAVIALCRDIGTRLLIAFHSTADVMIEGQNVSLGSIAGSLAQADGLLVHSPDDVARLRGFGLTDNIVLFPHGYIDAPAVDQRTARRELGLPEEGLVIGSYGFCLPHKGIDQLIEAGALLHEGGVKARLLMVNALYPIPQSQELLDRCRQIAKERGLEDYVTFENRFLPNEVSLRKLAACDVIVYAYQGTQESSSAAVRMGIAARRPVLCSPLPIFADVAEVVRVLPGIRPQDIRDGVRALLSDEAGRRDLLRRQDQWLHSHSWRRVAQILQDLLLPVPASG
jgi:glycosyltransferase involved in cell wall biosynthesis